jgi:hypothetical protein
MKNIREEIKFTAKGGILDLFDNAIKAAFNITDEEYDYICEHATDEEIEHFVSALGGMDTPSTFTQRRRALEVRNNYLIQMK